LLISFDIVSLGLIYALNRIGTISLIKDFATSMQQFEEEEAEQTAGASASADPIPPKTSHDAGAASFAEKSSTSDQATTIPKADPIGATGASETHVHGHMTLHSATPPPPQSGSSTPTRKDAADSQVKPEKKSGKSKMTPEQRAKMAALEEEKEKAREARIKDLVRELTTYIRPFVDAKHPGEASDAETVAFEKKTRLEAEDLKLESFGVELLHTIGNVYMTKSTNFMRSKKFFGGGFLGRLKEKGSMLKEGWGLLGSA
jgi:hypothetical protein